MTTIRGSIIAPVYSCLDRLARKTRQGWRTANSGIPNRLELTMPASYNPGASPVSRFLHARRAEELAARTWLLRDGEVRLMAKRLWAGLDVSVETTTICVVD